MKTKVKIRILIAILILTNKGLFSQNLPFKESWNYTLIDISNCVIKEDRFNFKVVCNLNEVDKIMELVKYRSTVSIIHETVDLNVITFVYGQRLKSNIEDQLGVENVSIINTSIYEIHGYNKVMILFVKHQKLFNLKRLKRKLRNEKFILNFQMLVR